MKNKFLILFFLLLKTEIFAENLNIQAESITLDKDKVTSIFENDVVIKSENQTITSQYLKYNKKTGVLILKDNVVAIDSKNNKVETEYAEFNEKERIFKSKGLTIITTTENYKIEAKDISFNGTKNIINSEKTSIIKDLDGNEIELENFEYQINENIFKSIGLINITDKNNNSYKFSQIYIDTSKKEILGTDIKVFLNQESFKINANNKPRVFSNTLKIGNDKTTFGKSVFTLCNYRKNDKCPPWTIQSSKMLHDNKKKTVFYDNAIIKVYDIPIFYFPKLSHPDPSVKRRSGFLPPSIYDTKNLGEGVSIPYFFNLARDKNLTITNRIYVSENPLFLGEYHQAFKNSNLLLDFGFTEGYKKTSATKTAGEKSHIFTEFVKNFKSSGDSDNSLSITYQDVSNDKYLKLYKIKSNLVDYNVDTLESSIKFTHENDDIFFGINANLYETLKETYNDKYEYILPELTLNKNIFSDDKLGNLDLETNLKVHLYDTNKLTNFFINDFSWNSKELFSDKGVQTKILSNIKNINYESKNVEPYKEDTTSELFGALGFLSKVDLQKGVGGTRHLLTPKMLVRYAPGSMRKEVTGFRLNPSSAFDFSRIGNLKNFETGLNAAIGFDYKIKKNQQDFNFSVAQIISERENKKMHKQTSLDEKLSDLVGSASLNFNKNFSLNYNFSLDQNYSDLNYNEIGAKLNYSNLNVKFDYLQENKHIGNQDYFKTKVDLKNKDKGLLSFETKRNLITNSSEFYNLSYEYINDCLRAGLIYRREFYNDSELEPENSLMFKITLTPFGSINSPTLSR